jgi:anti-sigma B factor antagonist
MGDDRLSIRIVDGERPGEQIVVAEGVLNTETAFRLRDSVRNRRADNLVIDMTGVRSVDSTGLGVLIGIYASCERDCRRLLLAGVNERIWSVFRTCKVEALFTRYPSVADAERTIPTAAG